MGLMSQVQELLEKQKIQYLQKGQDFLVKCLSPDHDDSTPSMRIDRTTGVFNCFSCSFKGNIFYLFGEKPDFLQLKREKLKKTIEKKRAESIGLAFPNNCTAYTGDWRDISPATYSKFDAFQSIEDDFIGRICFPVRDFTGRITAFIGRHTTGGTPKYKVHPHKAKLGVFPKVKPIQGSVILVEGIYDMLNLYDKGITNAVCIFGVDNINEQKLCLIKMLGASNIDLLLDPDEAGRKGADNIIEMCERLEITTRNWKLREDEDPGSLSQTRVDSIKEKLYG